MATLKEKIGSKIDRLARQAKKMAGKAVDRTQKEIRKMGDRVAKVGKKIKEKGS